ncbi:hypothetical protein KR032_006138 [Drosophila birchii]|nr:hypothetical protein KR032_006138 [Drosophila birchii]
MKKLKKQTKTSAKEEREERILKFILENRVSKATDTPHPPAKKSTKPNKSLAIPKKPDLSSCLITTPSMDPRLVAGENNPAVLKPPGKLPRTDSECQFHAPGFKFLKERHPNLAEQVLVLEPSKPIRKKSENKCDFFTKHVKSPPFQDQVTQTLYRESSAQTLAYLPEFSTIEANTKELFILPSIMPSDKPPGLYEVEVLERSRRRWAFYEAVKLNRKKFQISEKELRFGKYKSAIEAFEWEQWIEREEYIQECQMMRLQILIKMFDKREREMHAASKTRIEWACERIEERRQEALLKNEITYERGIRRLNIKMQRKWKKETPLEALGNPCSDYCAPKTRFGMDPARRHFNSATGQRAFDLRMDELEKQVSAGRLKCPFKKLNQLARPKEQVAEAERNICNENTLQGLYNSLLLLRQAGEVERKSPKCMKVKFKHTRERESELGYMAYHTLNKDHKTQGQRPKDLGQRTVRKERLYHEQKASIIWRDVDAVYMQDMISSYEASAIGLLMQFLWEETVRLQQERNLHFITLLAQKERCRREALESGLRQNENELRMLYEEIFQNSVRISNSVTDQYISSILTDDVDSIAGLEASDSVIQLAKQIDLDIERWLEGFKLIQNPLTYIPLRLMLRDMMSPDLEPVLLRHEKSLIVQYIIDDVIFGRVWEELEPFDVATALTSDFIDRLIDNDLYFFSTESESESGRPHTTSWYEAHAIIRKLIRQSVPGRRWKEETERIVYENYNDLLDDIFVELILNAENQDSYEPGQLRNVSNIQPSLGNISSSMCGSEISHTSRLIGTQVLSLIKKKNRVWNRQSPEAKPYNESRYVVMEAYKYPPQELAKDKSPNQDDDGTISSLITSILPQSPTPSSD